MKRDTSDYSSYNARLNAIQSLSACLSVTYEIECDECKKGNAIEGGNIVDATAEFMRKGWTTNAQGFAVCRRCGRKDTHRN